MVLLPGVPTLACPACQAGNKGNFRFCSFCGYARKRSQLTTTQQPPVDISAISLRLAQLRATHAAKKQSKLKDRELLAFEGFLRATGEGRTLHDANPLDVLHFLIWRDITGGGHTLVHRLDCYLVATTTMNVCSCPRRLSHESVRKIRSVLASALSNVVGRTEIWSPAAQSGNPAEAPEVKAYVGWIHEEQARAGVSSIQATPLLEDKLRLICDKLRVLASDPFASPFQRLEARRELAWYLLAWHSSIRNGQIASTFLATVIRTPDGRLLFNWTWGKTVRDAARGPVPVTPWPHDVSLCPVVAILNWVAAARAAGWAMTGGYLFPPLRRPRKSDARDAPVTMIPGQPGDPEAMNAQLRSRLTQWSTFAGETLNGTRSGGALRLRMAGASAASVDAHVGWKPTPHRAGASRMQEHYTSEARVCVAVGGQPEGAQAITPAQFRGWNSLPLLQGAARSPFLL